jgi:hypothetical protein
VKMSSSEEEIFLAAISRAINSSRSEHLQSPENKTHAIENIKAALKTPVDNVRGLLIPTFPALLHPSTDPHVVSAIAKCKFACFAHGTEWVDTLKRMNPSKDHMGIQLCQAARAERAVISATRTKAERSIYTMKATTPAGQITEACLAVATALCSRARFTPQGDNPVENEKIVREYLKFLTSSDTKLPPKVLEGIEADKVVKVVDGAEALFNGDGIKAFVSMRWVEAARITVSAGTSARARKIAQYRHLVKIFIESIEGNAFNTNQTKLSEKLAAQKAAREAARAKGPAAAADADEEE